MALTWKSLAAQSWFFSPRLEAWQRKALSDLRRRAPRIAKMAWVLSSGTQSLRSIKAIALSHESIFISADSANRHLRSTAKDRWLVAIPNYHIGGLSIYARAHLSGAKVREMPGKWSAKKFAQAIEDSGTTLTSLVPAQVHDLVAARLAAPSSLRAAVIGGGALAPSLYKEACDLGWPMLPSYGLTECCSQVATASLASINGADYPALEVLKHVKVELRDQRIFLRSDSLCRWVATADSEGQYTLEDPKRDGWLATSDAAEKMGKGLKILGRRDDVVKVLGLLVPLQEVESRAREFFSSRAWTENFSILPVSDLRNEHRFICVTDSQRNLSECEKVLAEYNSMAQGPYRIQGLCWISKLPLNELGKLCRNFLVEYLFGAVKLT